MNRNYSNVDKKCGELNTFMSIMLMKKIKLDMRMWGPFHNKSSVIVSCENVWTNNWVQIKKSCNKTIYFCLKTKFHRKGYVRNFLLDSIIFFTKFDLYNTTFQSLFSQIIWIWELFFRWAVSYLSCKLLCLQRKTALPLSRNLFLSTIGASLVEKADFFLTNGNKRISIRKLVLIWHIFQHSKIKTISKT